MERQAVVLAAGNGGRMLQRTTHLPKPLITVRGRPLIAHVLSTLRAAGVTSTTIVLGYRGDQVRDALAGVAPAGMTLRFVQNDAWMLGNARSLWEARTAVEGSFLLVMSDHLLDAAILTALADGARERCRLAIERASAADPRAGEATRALVEDGRVVDLGKRIEQWNALDTGAFWCAPSIFDAMTPSLRDGEAGAVFASLARGGDLDAIDVTGSRWLDVDTEADLQQAEVLLAAEHGARGRIA